MKKLMRNAICALAVGVLAGFSCAQAPQDYAPERDSRLSPTNQARKAMTAVLTHLKLHHSFDPELLEARRRAVEATAEFRRARQDALMDVISRDETVNFAQARILQLEIELQDVHAVFPVDQLKVQRIARNLLYERTTLNRHLVSLLELNDGYVIAQDRRNASFAQLSAVRREIDQRIRNDPRFLAAAERLREARMVAAGRD
jgi:hypothetical protein